MSPKQTTALRLDGALLDAMRAVRESEGVPITTQIEMATREWLAKRGVSVKKAVKKTDRKRAATRKRS